MLSEFHFARVAGAYPYLRAQKGRLGHLEDDVFWSAYDRAVFRDYLDIAPHLPAFCQGMLDVGGGMGGIDAVVAAHYELDQPQPAVAILDGDYAAPVMRLHREPFSNRAVCEQFLQANGVCDVRYVTPANARKAVSGPSAWPEVDLVISLGSWCFHYPPKEYLDYVISSSSPGATVILDVRCGKSEWDFSLMQSFEQGPIIRRSDNNKFERRVYFNAGPDRLLQDRDCAQAGESGAA